MAVASELQRRKPGAIYTRQRWMQPLELARDVSAPDPGSWIDLEGIHPFTVTIEGDFVGVAHFLVCNRAGDVGSPDPPDDSQTDHAQVGSDITGPTAIAEDAPYRYGKLWVETVDSGTIRRAVFLGVERPGS